MNKDVLAGLGTELQAGMFRGLLQKAHEGAVMVDGTQVSAPVLVSLAMNAAMECHQLFGASRHAVALLPFGDVTLGLHPNVPEVGLGRTLQERLALMDPQECALKHPLQVRGFEAWRQEARLGRAGQGLLESFNEQEFAMKLPAQCRGWEAKMRQKGFTVKSTARFGQLEHVISRAGNSVTIVQGTKALVRNRAHIGLMLDPVLAALKSAGAVVALKARSAKIEKEIEHA